MEKIIDVCALGELLIDFNELGCNENGSPIMEANPGGAPCNVLSMLVSLGRRAAFIGKVGRDNFGNQLRRAIRSVGIDDAGLCVDERTHTTLAFVHNHEDGEREFSFYRNPGADELISTNDIDKHRDLIEKSRIFHLGTLLMTNEVGREATLYALSIAEQAGCLVSYDPNLRESLWADMDAARACTTELMKHCHILKISDNEISWLLKKAAIYPEQDRDFVSKYIELARELQRSFPNIVLLTLSLGKYGSIALCNGAVSYEPAFLQPDTVDTTGAGDTFGACILHQVLNGLPKSEEALGGMLRYANAAASIVTTRKGALMSMPSQNEIKEIIDLFGYSN